MTIKFRSLLFWSACVLFVFQLSNCGSKEFKPHEGFIEVDGGTVWYRIVGHGKEAPMLVLHGGPGASCYSLDPLRGLSTDRSIIFFDQLGGGRSDRITDTSLMTLSRYVEEVEQMRESLNLDDFYLYGHSWGTMLGLDYYLKYPDHVRGIIFNSPLFSTDLWLKDADTLIFALPDSIQTIISTNEANKTYDNTEYQDAIDLFYSKYLRRKERPQAQIDSANMFFGTNVYEYMWGPSEFTATGNLENYDRLQNLSDVSVPTLLITGEFDEARPTTVQYYQSLIPGAEFIEITNSGHYTIHDNLQETLAAIRQFLNN